MIKMVGKEKAMTIGIQPTINASILLRPAQVLDIPRCEGAIGALHSGTAAFNCSPALIWILAAPLSGLAVTCLATFFIFVAAFSLIGSMAVLAKGGLSAWLCSAIEEAGIGHCLSTTPAPLYSSVAETLLFLAILFSAGISCFLTAFPTMRRIAISIGRVFVEARQGLDNITTRTALETISDKPDSFQFGPGIATDDTVGFVSIWGGGAVIKLIKGFKLSTSSTTFKHVLASVRKSVVSLWGKVGTENLLFGPSAYPKNHYTRKVVFCQVRRCSV